MWNWFQNLVLPAILALSLATSADTYGQVSNTNCAPQLSKQIERIYDKAKPSTIELPTVQELNERIKDRKNITEKSYQSLTDEQRKKVDLRFGIMEALEKIPDPDGEIFKTLESSISQISVKEFVRERGAIFIEEFFPSKISAVKKSPDIISADLAKFIKAQYSPSAIEGLRNTAVIEMKQHSKAVGGHVQELNGSFFSVKEGQTIRDRELYKIQVEVKGKKMNIEVPFILSNAEPYFRNILFNTIGSDSVIRLNHMDGKSRMAELSRTWTATEEVMHALDETEFPEAQDYDENENESLFLTAHAKENEKRWAKEDIDSILSQPNIKDLMFKTMRKYTKAHATDVVVEEKIRAALEETYSDEYTRTWPYVVSEVELRGKWRTVQYLKHHRKVSFEDILKIEVWKSDPKAIDNSLFPYRYMPKRLVDFWKKMYDSDDKAPIELNPYLKSSAARPRNL